MRSLLSAVTKVTALCAVTALTSCSGSDSQSKVTDQAPQPQQDMGSDFAQYNRASCQFGFTQGNSASLKGPQNIQNIFFDKKLDRSLLEPVLGASAAETIRFAEETGVRFYKISPKVPSNCGFLQSLPQAPLDLQDEFQEANTSGGVVGLYLFAGTVGIKSTDEKAAIVVRSDANKWTVVHEYLHHLFHIQSGNESDLSDLQSEYQRITLEYKNLRKKVTKVKAKDRTELINKLADKLTDAGQLLLLLLKKYYLEEMTIEMLLAQELSEGRFTQVIEDQRLNGAAYTVLSADKARRLLNAFETDLQYLKLVEPRAIRKPQLMKLDAVTTQFATMRNDILLLSDQATSYLDSKVGKNYTLNGIRAAAKRISINKNSPHGGCAHAEEADEFFSSVETLEDP